MIRQLFAAVTPMAPLKATRPQAMATLHGESPALKVRVAAHQGMRGQRLLDCMCLHHTVCSWLQVESCLQQLVDAHGL